MKRQRTIVCTVGTRPEVIKMAPVIARLRENSRYKVVTLFSGQHRELVAPLVEWFGLRVDDNLDVMTEGQSLSALTARLMPAFENVLHTLEPHLVLAQGDTTTVMCAALSCFYLRIPFGHVEAGLRTLDLENPFPEEFNRVVAGRLARLHFCPTRHAAEHLLREGASTDHVHVTGNTVIDALFLTRDKLRARAVPATGYDILLTAHRRENFGTPLENVLMAVKRLCEEFPHLRVLYPVHPNPNVREPVQRILAGQPGITLAPPLDYPELVRVMLGTRFVLTDSGGIQEEAPALGKPVLVLRKRSERPEAIEAGIAKLVGTDTECILAECRRLLTDPDYYASMATRALPYGDGHAAERISGIIAEFL